MFVGKGICTRSYIPSKLYVAGVLRSWQYAIMATRSEQYAAIAIRHGQLAVYIVSKRWPLAAGA